MTQDEIIRMAREAGFINLALEPKISRFAALVAAHEREACAKVCDKLGAAIANPRYYLEHDYDKCAAAIRDRSANARARGEK